MKLTIVPIAGLMLLVALADAPAADDKVKESPFYPMKIGTKWHYQIAMNKFVMQVKKHEKIGDATYAVLEASADGKALNTEYFGVRSDGIYRFSMQGKKLDKPYCILKLPPKKGATWKAEFKISGELHKGTFVSGEEEVTVPAGKFQAVTAFSQGFLQPDKKKITYKYWFAEKVGLVKQTTDIGDNITMIGMELEKFEAP
jgi:hypothetical protein